MITAALAELEEYVRLAILAPDLETRAKEVIEFANQRVRAGEQTVVALAGATGSGKSSLFNALSGTTLATVAARRPTTAKPLALSFSATNGPLLNLLQITRRHEAPPPTPDLADVVLLDLPDHDSTHLRHREEVDRLVRIIDQFIFVVDPQKYADAALHHRYLRPLAQHRDVISVVLNHADAATHGAPLIDDDGRWQSGLAMLVEHLRAMLQEDGLGDVPVFATSALTGEGVDELREHIATIAREKSAMRLRLAADLHNLARDLSNYGGVASTVSDADVAALQEEVAAAAGVPWMARAVRQAVQRRGAMLGARPDGTPALELPAHRVASAADDARAATAVRRFVADSTANLPERWRDHARSEISRPAGEQLGARVDAAMRDVELADLESPFGWGLVRLLKWLPVVTLAACGGWLAYEVVWGSDEFLPRLLTIAAAAFVGTVLVSILGDWSLRLGARRAEKKTARRLRAAVDAEVVRGVVTPVKAELEAHQRAESALQRMTGILARG